MTRRKIDLMHDKFGYGNGICKGCKHFERFEYHNKAYRKCAVYGITSSSASDWSGKYKACGLYNKEYKGDKPIISLITAKKDDGPIEGQISLF